jgi:hypothetical protein
MAATTLLRTFAARRPVPAAAAAAAGRSLHLPGCARPSSPAAPPSLASLATAPGGATSARSAASGRSGRTAANAMAARYMSADGGHGARHRNIGISAHIDR